MTDAWCITFYSDLIIVHQQTANHIFIQMGWYTLVPLPI